MRILTVVSSERNSLQVTKLIGVSKEKFEQKYAKKIEGDIGSPKSQKEDSNPSTTARHTADVPSSSILSHSGESVNNFSKDDGIFRSEKEESLYGLMGEEERIRKENAKLREDVERLKLESKITGGNQFNMNQNMIRYNLY